MTSDDPVVGLDAGQITASLRRAGVLGDAHVCTVTVLDDAPTILSQITRLGLAYDGPAPDAPASVILKRVHPERRARGWVGGRQEVAFYTRVAPATGAGLLPRCFAAVADEATSPNASATACRARGATSARACWMRRRSG